MKDPKAIAQEFKGQCQELGFSYSVSGTILRVSKHFQAGDLDAFTKCDMDAPFLLGIVPMTSPGSIWGTDGGSVGGHVAVTSGSFVMNKSGCSKRILAILKK